VDNHRAETLRHSRDIPRAASIDCKCFLWLLLALLYMMESHCVNDYFRRDSRKHSLDRIRRLHIHLGMSQAMNGIAARLKFLADVSANLPFCSDHSNHHLDLLTP
jgi:hypothetical protein